MAPDSSPIAIYQHISTSSSSSTPSSSSSGKGSWVAYDNLTASPHQQQQLQQHQQQEQQHKPEPLRIWKPDSIDDGSVMTVSPTVSPEHAIGRGGKLLSVSTASPSSSRPGSPFGLRTVSDLYRRRDQNLYQNHYLICAYRHHGIPETPMNTNTQTPPLCRSL
jgi:hypothetical protein